MTCPGLLLKRMFYSEAGPLFNKLLCQGYVKNCLQSSLRKFYGRYGTLIKIWSSLLKNSKWHSVGWPYTMAPSTDQTLYQIMTLLPNLTFYGIMSCFHRVFATGMTYDRGRSFLRTPVPSHFRTCIVRFVETNSFP